MTRLNVDLNHDSFPEIVNRVLKGERIIIEQKNQSVAAIITYAELQRLEAIDALLEKTVQEEQEWLKIAVRNPAFDSLKDSREDIYTLKDGQPFSDPEWTKTVVDNPSYHSIIESETELFTLDDGKPYHDNRRK
jgi:antitoxin (DNA-binding transcriptional repressor) of toxin-antitoxin stability system